MKRLLPARVGIAHAPSQALCALPGADVLLLEDRSWPEAEDEALCRIRELSAARKLALILSRQRGESFEPSGVPVVERPYRMDEVVAAVRLALLRKKA